MTIITVSQSSMIKNFVKRPRFSK